MPESGYPLRQVVTDLMADGLYTGCMLAEAGRWLQLGSGAEASLQGFFKGAILDSRVVASGQLFVALAGDHVDGRHFITDALRKGAVALTRAWPEPAADPLLKEEVPPSGTVLFSRDPQAALTHLAGHWRDWQSVRITAVTGTNGKTTTKDLIRACLGQAGPTHATPKNWNNDLGLPLTLLGLQADHRFAAVELGASAVGDIARLAALARPQVGVITNAAEAHLAEFGSLAGVIEGKGELLDALPVDGTAVLNADSPGFTAWCERATCRVVSFGHETGDVRWWWRPDKTTGLGIVELDGKSWSVPLPGAHNGANLVAAVIAARANDVTDDDIRTGLLAFVPSPHRSCVRQLAGRWLLDDCYNANPTSMASAAAALVALPAKGRAIAVLGVMAELGPDSQMIHRGTGHRLSDHGIDILVAVGSETEPLADGFAAAGGEVQKVSDQAEAAAWLVKHTRPGDALLIKGSRVAAMEKVITELARQWTAQSTTN